MLLACAVSIAVMVGAALHALGSVAPGPVGPATLANAAEPASRLVSAGAPAPEDTAFPVPEHAVFVSASGRDRGAGSAADPLRTVWAGINHAQDGGTVVIRAGVYHETVVLPESKHLTVQAYPHETVWFDGSERFEAWRPVDTVWTADFTQRFDSSPTYDWGAPDGTRPGWQFVNSAHPMAAHPEQVWVDGRAQRQVGSRAAVTANTFFVDVLAGRLYLGTDPRGKAVDVSTLRQAVVLQGAGEVLRGVGIRRYGDSVPHQGVVTVLAPGSRVEAVSIIDSATTGLGVLAGNTTISHVTVARSGMLGIAGFQADGSTFDHVVSVDNNVEHFNHAPAAGGLKITRSRGVSITSSEFARNDGTGLWVDESCYDIDLVGNDVLDNAEHGVVAEISAKAIIANNRVSGNARDGIVVADSGHVSIWNNTLVANARAINLTQDGRNPLDITVPGRDLRVAQPDASVPWQLRGIDVHNNVLALPNGKADAFLAVEDYTGKRRAEDLTLDINGNVYVRHDSSSPRWAVVWARPGDDPAVFHSVEDFSRATGQEMYHYSDGTADILDSASNLSPSGQAFADSIARPLPADVAQALGRPSGTRHSGTW